MKFIGRRSFPLIGCWGLKLMNSFLPGNFSTISPGQDEVYRRVRRISTITAVSFWEHAIIAWERNRQVDALVSWSSRSRTPHDEGISGEASKMRDSISVWALKSVWLLHITKSSRISLARWPMIYKSWNALKLPRKSCKVLVFLHKALKHNQKTINGWLTKNNYNPLHD